MHVIAELSLITCCLHLSSKRDENQIGPISIRYTIVMHIYMFAYLYAYPCAYTCMHIHARIPVCISMHVYLYAYPTCAYTCMHIHACVPVCISMRVYPYAYPPVCISICVYPYAYISTQKLSVHFHIDSSVTIITALHISTHTLNHFIKLWICGY